jgi:uncharacterized protein (DUF302 family)
MTTPHRTRLGSRPLGIAAIGAVLALGAAACGSNTSPTSSANAGNTAAASTSAAGAPAAATGSGVSAAFMTSTTSASFDQTLAAAKQAISGNGMMVLGTLNQAGALSSTGLQLKGAQTLLVGNPTTGKMFFQQDPVAGATLPMRIYVWADGSGSHVGYMDPASELTAINPAFSQDGSKLSMMASAITKSATGQAPTAHGQGALVFKTVDSPKSFDATVSGLKTSVASGGMMVLGDADQAKVLSMTGLSLRGAHAFFVGNPTTGKMFFQQDPAIGAVLPVEMYVWADGKGSHVGYFDPTAEFTAVDPQLSSGASKISMMAGQIAQGAAS